MPEIDRQQAIGLRVAFRADAAFARPAIYKALEARGLGYASASRPTRIWNWRSKTSCFGRRDGPATKPLVRYKSFRIRRTAGSRPDGSWRRSSTTSASYSLGSASSLRISGSPIVPSCASTTSAARHGRGMDQRGQAGGHWTRLSCHRFRANEVPPAAERARVQPREISGGGSCCRSALTAGH